ncbi:MAG: SPFH domain-containing protein [Streptococcaceae bacterium]|jgi:regulator of protease activity HflC (stomatin/prohibitin superfamily)|nr:SPFH domain-containing protein [Streptococcaceae bacterium]
MIGVLVFLVLVLVVVFASAGTLFFSVRQQTVAIVERLGKYSMTAQPGFHVKAPWGIDRIAARIQLRMLQNEITIETKTKDNVFVTMNVATQYRVNEQSIKDAYYKLMNPGDQIKSYIEDALRSAVPKLTLDELFEKKDEIALEVQNQVAEEMQTYGYIIVKTLITRVEPDAEVKQSMNEINAAQRKQDAAQMLANANKIQVVTAAEAEAEKDRLHGVGIAEQRKAIVDGLAQQIQEMKNTGVDLSEESIMSILLTNQYLDTLNQFAGSGNSTIFLPGGAEGVEDLRTQILSALKAASNK